MFTRAAEERSADLPRMFEVNYPQLRSIVDRLFAHEPPGISINPTELVHEAFLALINNEKIGAEGTIYFKQCFARQCWTLLVDRARKRKALRRGGGMQKVSLSGQSEVGVEGDFEIVMLDDAIQELSKIARHLGELATMRMVGGLTIEECASELRIPLRRVEADMAYLRAWMKAHYRG